jgi:pseudaminic acid biosynthesis-associated methylase
MPTAQEEFWAGGEGDAYTRRNGRDLLRSKVEFFRKALWWTTCNGQAGLIHSVIEFGANQGLNLRALDKIDPDRALTGVEINRDACERMVAIGGVEVVNGSILAWDRPGQYDLCFTMGLLIHIAPGDLPKAYDTLYRASSKYVLIAEYYSRQPVEIEYRGHAGRLWKRDFCTEFMERFRDMKRVDYGYVDRHDPYPLDDIHWWLFRKSA